MPDHRCTTEVAAHVQLPPIATSTAVPHVATLHDLPPQATGATVVPALRPWHNVLATVPVHVYPVGLREPDSVIEVYVVAALRELRNVVQPVHEAEVAEEVTPPVNDPV